MATTEFDTSLPSIRQIQQLIKQAALVDFKMVTGDLITGKISWHDPNCVCIVDEHQQQITLWKHAIAYFHLKH